VDLVTLRFSSWSFFRRLAENHTNRNTVRAVMSLRTARLCVYSACAAVAVLVFVGCLESASEVSTGLDGSIDATIDENSDHVDDGSPPSCGHGQLNPGGGGGTAATSGGRSGVAVFSEGFFTVGDAYSLTGCGRPNVGDVELRRWRSSVATPGVDGAVEPSHPTDDTLCLAPSSDFPNGNWVGTAITYSAGNKRVAVAATRQGAITPQYIFVASVSEEDLNWTKNGTRPPIQVWGTFPEDVAATAPADTVVRDILYSGDRLFVVGSSAGKGSSVLFTPGVATAKGQTLHPTALVVDGVTILQSVAAASDALWAAGISTSGRAALLKLKADNSVDDAFGSAGLLELGDVGAGAVGLAVSPAGVIFLAAGFGDTTVAWRLDAMGALDTKFGGSGSVHVPLPNPDEGHLHLAAENDAALLVPGFVRAASGLVERGGYVRVLANGTLDDTLGMTGVAMGPPELGSGPSNQPQVTRVHIAAPPDVAPCTGPAYLSVARISADYTEAATTYVFVP
jgi:hypothetical protein